MSGHDATLALSDDGYLISALRRLEAAYRRLAEAYLAEVDQ